MKKILSIFLTFVLIIGALPLSAQEDNASMPTITRKDLSDLIDPNELQKQMNKEHRRYNFSVSDDEAAFQDFVKFQDKRKQEFLQASNS